MRSTPERTASRAKLPRLRRPVPTGILRGSALAVSIGLLSFGVVGADGPAADVDGTRATLEQWVETRRVISRERRDWKLSRETLSDRIELVEREIQTLRARVRETNETIAEANTKREELLAENGRLEDAASSLNGIIAGVEDRTRLLLTRLPDPLRERVKMLSQRLPADPADTELSLSERFLNVVGILNEANRFNGEVTVTSEVRSLQDGSSVEVTAMYVGVGQAYYVSANGTAAGIGTATPEGWVWKPANDAASDIRRAIAVLRNEEAAQFVPLPIHIDDGPSNEQNEEAPAP